MPNMQNHDMITKFTEQIRSELVDMERPTLEWDTFVPIDFDVPEGIQSIRSFAIEKVGKMQIASGGLGENFPTVDYNLTSKDADMNYAKTGYTISRADMEAEKITGLKPLGIKIGACFDAYHEFMTDNILTGSALIPGSSGLLTLGGSPMSSWGTHVQEDGKTPVDQAYATKVGGTFSMVNGSPFVTMPMEDMSAEQLFLSFTRALGKIPSQTLVKYKATHIMLPAFTHITLSTKIFLNGFQRSVLSALEETEGKILGQNAPGLKIIGTPYIQNQKMVMYHKSPKAMRVYIGNELLFLPNQDVGIDQYAPGYCKVSGLVIDDPMVFHTFMGVEDKANTIGASVEEAA